MGQEHRARRRRNSRALTRLSPARRFTRNFRALSLAGMVFSLASSFLYVIACAPLLIRITHMHMSTCHTEFVNESVVCVKYVYPWTHIKRCLSSGELFGPSPAPWCSDLCRLGVRHGLEVSDRIKIELSASPEEQFSARTGLCTLPFRGRGACNLRDASGINTNSTVFSYHAHLRCVSCSLTL